MKKDKLPDGWEWQEIGNCCSVINGSTPKTGIEEYWEGNIVWITPTDLGRNRNKYIADSERKITKCGYESSNTTLIPPRSIILSTRAPIGYIAMNNIETCTNQGCKGIVPHNSVYPDFVFYYLYFSKKELDELGSGSTFKELSTESLKSFLIPLPPLDEQKRIARIIETKLEAVEKAKQAAGGQKSLSRLLFLSYLQKSISNKEWNCVRLGEICEFIGGSQPPKSTFIYSPKKDYIRLVQMQDFRRNDTTVYIPRESARKTFKKDDIMIGRYGPPVFQIFRGLEGAYNVALMKAQPKDENILAKNFLFYLLQGRSLQSAVINQSQRTAGQSGADKEFLEKQFVYVPDIKTQKTIAESIDKYKIKISILDNLLKEQSSYIEALQYSILRQAFRGEL